MDTMVQLLALNTDLEHHNIQRDGRTDGRHCDANSRSYCTIRSAKTESSNSDSNYGLLNGLPQQ